MTHYLTFDTEQGPVDLHVCPNGCEKEELEVGKDESSFMAMLGSPYMYLRCGKCGFGEKGKEKLSLNLPDAISVWNGLCESKHPEQECYRIERE